MNQYKIFYDVTLFNELDIYLFKEGTHAKLYEKFGAHFLKRADEEGIYFALWAPNALGVSVRGDFNDYNKDAHKLHGVIKNG